MCRDQDDLRTNQGTGARPHPAVQLVHALNVDGRGSGMNRETALLA